MFRRVGLAGCLAASAIGAAAPPPPSALPAPMTGGSLPALRRALQDRYPMVRAVLIRRGECPLFDFYKAGVDADTRLPLHSITKSVLSILLGMAKDRGLLNFDLPLGDVLPEALDPALDPHVRAITIRQLLTMTAGFDAEAKTVVLPPPEAWRWALGRPLLSVPGQAFRYDNQNGNMLSVILSRRLRQSAEAFARHTLFAPLGIVNYSWLDDGEGHSIGAYGLWLTAPDMAKIGLLALHHGRWTGVQIVSEAFLADATHRHNEGGTPFRAAYGYLWWIKPTRTGLDAFMAEGSDGQLIYVVPKRDLVIVLAEEKSPPGGPVEFVNDVVLTALAAAPRTCPSGGGP